MWAISGSMLVVFTIIGCGGGGGGKKDKKKEEEGSNDADDKASDVCTQSITQMMQTDPLTILLSFSVYLLLYLSFQRKQTAKKSAETKSTTTPSKVVKKVTRTLHPEEEERRETSHFDYSC